KNNPDTEALEKVKLHLYDAMLPVPYPERYKYIASYAKNADNVVLIPSYEVEASEEIIKEKLEQFLAEGHEGLMIRKTDVPYENKRSWQLLKVKEFQDEEFTVVDILEDARGGIVGAFVIQLNTPTTDRDGKVITTFNAGIKNLTQKEGLEILNNKDKYIGKKATIEYFSKSEYGIPRFPKLKAFRD